MTASNLSLHGDIEDQLDETLEDQGRDDEARPNVQKMSRTLHGVSLTLPFDGCPITWLNSIIRMLIKDGNEHEARKFVQCREAIRREISEREHHIELLKGELRANEESLEYLRHR
jgi:hypothetical protein